MDGKEITLTHWWVVRNDDNGIDCSFNSRDDGRWGITKANEALEQLGSDYRIEIWEEIYFVGNSKWRQVNTAQQ